jgi:hypothetical protein
LLCADHVSSTRYGGIYHFSLSFPWLTCPYPRPFHLSLLSSTSVRPHGSTNTLFPHPCSPKHAALSTFSASGKDATGLVLSLSLVLIDSCFRS